MFAEENIEFARSLNLRDRQLLKDFDQLKMYSIEEFITKKISDNVQNEEGKSEWEKILLQAIKEVQELGLGKC